MNEAMSSSSTDEKRPRTTLAEVIRYYVANIAHFLAPIVVAHGLGWRIWKAVANDPDGRGPWEFLWFKLLGVIGTEPFYLMTFG